LNPF